jgi:type IV pilus assembly protein PilY1
MHTVRRILLVSGGALVAGLATTPAHAQPSDTLARLPNVLLLIDNSGSMEYLMNMPGKLPGDVAGTACDGSATPSVRTSWANLLTALTGTITDTDYRCVAVSRKTTDWHDEYILGTNDPYDYGYYLPYHRVYSNSCAYGAGKLPSTSWQWWTLPGTQGGSDVRYHTLPLTAAATASSPANEAPLTNTACAFRQANDGALDDFRGLVRFGMMALDSFPDPGTGSSNVPVTGAEGAYADYDSARTGMWSYFDGWVAGPYGAASTATTSVGANGVDVINNERIGAGYPPGCAPPRWFEVGARSAAAPPWEGRLVPFGDWHSDSGVILADDQIQQQLLQLRPFGSTPLAGLLDDARVFLFKDKTKLSTNNYQFGPSDDEYWKNGCRKVYTILISDGADNMSLRAMNGSCTGPVGNKYCVGTNPAQACNADSDCPVITGCDSAGGVCPYDTPDAVAKALRTQAPTSSQAVNTYVVGITSPDIQAMVTAGKLTSLPPSGAVHCSNLNVTSGADCTPPPGSAVMPEALRACCNLQKIAVQGGTNNAYFATNKLELQQALGAILTEIITSSGQTDRTWPVYAAADTRIGQGHRKAGLTTASYKFAASFKPAIAAAPSASAVAPGLWNGVLTRERTSCPATNLPTPQTVRWQDGDDYALNVDSADSSHKRHFFTELAPTDGHGVRNSDWTLRPYYTGTSDGLGNDKPSGAPQPLRDAPNFVSTFQAYPEAFGLSDTDCNTDFGTSGASRFNDCTQRLLNWEVGISNVGLLPAGKTPYTRLWNECQVGSKTCTSARGCPCSQLGAIVHSTPVVVGPPREFVRDETYTDYASTPAVASQPTMLYTATLDGQLHAFKVQSNMDIKTDPDPIIDNLPMNNELWSFFPPTVLNNLLGSYNKPGAKLLDGGIVVADVPGTDTAKHPGSPILFTRIGTGDNSWHRVLLSGGGQAGGFYYALEVTDPKNPRFLWQLSTDDKGNHLFGLTTPTPAIALVNIRIAGVVQQVAIAILPGGSGVESTDCHPPGHAWGWDNGDHHHSRRSSVFNDPSQSAVAAGLNDPRNPHLLTVGSLDGDGPPLQCWDMHTHQERSTGNNIVIARLDTGEVLGYFNGNRYVGAPIIKGDGHDDDDWGDHHDHNSITTVFDSPFNSPVTGVPVPYPNQTGQLADRFYVGDADGVLWRIDMSDPDISNWDVKLVWDAYATDPQAATQVVREGINITPILARDPIGNPILLIATGDQDNFASQPTKNHIWSIFEHPADGKTSPNWHIELPANGPRVTGPMALFNGALYFSSFNAYASGSTATFCGDGKAAVWGVDYLRRTTNAPSAGDYPTLSPAPAGLVWPAPRFPGPAGTPIWGSNAGANSIIMGMSVGETPTCDSTGTVNDAYGSHISLSLGGAGSSAYQVMWQTGAGSGVSGNSAVQNSSNIGNLQFIQPPPPGQGTRVDSWASIID